MKILRVTSEKIREFESNNQFIPLKVGVDCNYYLINQDIYGYEEVERIPDANDIVQGTMESIIKSVSYRSNERLKEDIAHLQKQLGESDYKVLKMYEYSMTGQGSPYDMYQVHSERQLLRDQINAMEIQIKPIKSWEELGNIIIDNRKNI